MKVALNGKIIDENKAALSVGERGFLYADGYFDTFRLIGGRVFLQNKRLARMAATAAALGLPQPTEALFSLAVEVAAANGHTEGAGRITVTRGALPAGPRPQGAGDPTVLISTRPLPPDLAQRQKNGQKCVTLGRPMRAGGLFPEGHKTLAYLGSVMALMAARNGEEPLLETLGGHLSEGATSNLFWATDGSLFTPSLATGCLPGIMRGEVLEVAREAGIKIVEGSFGLSSLKGAEEGFLTNSVTGIIPVSAVDDFIMPAPLPGPVTTSLMEKLQARMESFRKEKP